MIYSLLNFIPDSLQAIICLAVSILACTAEHKETWCSWVERFNGQQLLLLSWWGCIKTSGNTKERWQTHAVSNIILHLSEITMQACGVKTVCLHLYSGMFTWVCACCEKEIMCVYQVLTHDKNSRVLLGRQHQSLPPQIQWFPWQSWK